MYKHEKTLRFGQSGGWILVSFWEIASSIAINCDQFNSINLELTTSTGVGLVYKCAARRNGLIWSSLFSRIYTLAIPKCSQILSR